MMRILIRFDIKLPFTDINQNRSGAMFEGTKYFISAGEGSFSKQENGSVFRISPKMNLIILNLAEKD